MVTKNISTLESDGFVMIRGLFNSSETKKAYEEIEEHYRCDREARIAENISEPHWQGPSGYFIATKPSHLMIDAYAKSPTLDRMVEKLLTSPETEPLIRALAGKNIKLRGYNIRRMTGAYDPPPAHEWHRDSLGEFGLGILLTDIAPEENAATSFVPGSHLFPYCPRWNNLFYTPETISPQLMKYAFFNRRLSKKALQNQSGASGKRGDAYIFINDTWHGRQPNLHGKESMVVLIGAFPTDYEFPDRVTPPKKEILDILPPALRSAASGALPRNERSDTILRRTISNRMPVGYLSIWRLAQIERRFFIFVSILISKTRFKKFVKGLIKTGNI